MVRSVVEMDQFGGAGHSERVDYPAVALCAHRARRHVSLYHGHRVSGSSQADSFIILALRRVVLARRATIDNQSADIKQSNGLDQNRHSGSLVHYSKQSHVLGYFEPGRSGIPGHRADQDSYHRYIHCHFAQEEPQILSVGRVGYSDHRRGDYSNSECQR